jgi:hypothetical protein
LGNLVSEVTPMINGAHAVIFTKDAEGLRAFLRDTLGFPSIDAGGGWLIFALPPAELAAHPADDDGRLELYLMCDDVAATVEELKQKGASFAAELSLGARQRVSGESDRGTARLGDSMTFENLTRRLALLALCLGSRRSSSTFSRRATA